LVAIMLLVVSLYMRFLRLMGTAREDVSLM
jgi:spermidine/putrescine transport system permease protein